MSHVQYWRASVPTGASADYKAAHLRAVQFEPIGRMVTAWAAYADQYALRYDGAALADDGVLGEQWETIGHALLALLNGDLGRMDGGTADGFIRDTLEAEGCSTE